MPSHRSVPCILLALIPLAVAQCLTDQNPYCAGNAEFEKLCCTYPDVCYWADRQGTPGCCPAGEFCRDQNGFTVTPQPIYTTIQPVPVQPTTIYTTVNPPQTKTTYVQPTQQTCCQTITTVQQQPTQAPTVVITTTQPGIVEGIGSTIVAAGSSVVNVFQGAAPTLQPLRHAARAMIVVAVVVALDIG